MTSFHVEKRNLIVESCFRRDQRYGTIIFTKLLLATAGSRQKKTCKVAHSLSPSWRTDFQQQAHRLL